MIVAEAPPGTALIPHYQTELARERLRMVGPQWAKVEVDIRLVAINEFTLHPSVQRDVDRERVENYEGQWNPFAVFLFLAMVDSKGRKLLFDGQHRWESMRDLYPDKVEQSRVGIPTMLFYNVPEDVTAAQLQLLLQTQRAWTYVDKFYLRIKAKDPDALMIEHILGKYNVGVAREKRTGYTCVTQLQNVYELSKDALENVIETVEASWPGDGDARTGVIVMGLGYIFFSYPNIDVDDLVEVLRTKTPENMITSARIHARDQQTSIASQIAIGVRDSYNKKHPSGRKRLGMLTLPERVKRPLGA